MLVVKYLRASELGYVLSGTRGVQQYECQHITQKVLIRGIVKPSVVMTSPIIIGHAGEGASNSLQGLPVFFRSV